MQVWPYTLQMFAAESCKFCLRLGSAEGELLVDIIIIALTSFLVLISKSEAQLILICVGVVLVVY